MAVISALVPVFLLILLGHGLYRAGFPGEGFWLGAERLTYYVLFPVMLVYTLGRASFPMAEFALLLPLVLVMLILATGLLLLAWRWCRWPGPVFASVFQGGIRFNSYLGLAAATSVLGPEGMAVAALAMAVMIPLLNMLCIVMFALVGGKNGPGVAGVLKAMAANPLILGSLAGVAVSVAPWQLPGLAAGFMAPLSEMALPLGLMTVGAGLRLSALRQATWPFVWSSSIKLVLYPVLTGGLLWLGGISGMLVTVLVLLAALPTASSSYILARQLGGDAPLMAAIISGQTLLAMITLPVILALLV
ncbi:MAG: AEC family transporter [Halomonadaceae bacterium]|nr:MAG: AEC family transporter [Halomonadaceae bacterium]